MLRAHALRREPAVVPVSAQIIGLVKNRLSGIVLSRHAYADVLRTLWPDLRDATVPEGAQRPCAVNVWAARPLSKLVLDGFQRRLPGLHVWCVVLESTALPAGSLEACANADQVWVPSTFVREVCVAGGMPAGKVQVVPYWIPPPPRARVLPEVAAPFTVLVSWDGRSSLNRKNVLGSIAAFKAAWPADAGVRLRLKTRDLTAENVRRVEGAVAGDARITLDMRTLETVDEIFDGAHALLHLHRAEGYGRHVIEAMQRRLPVIATAHSGPLDWLTNENALLVDHTLVPTGQQEFQYPQGGLWAEPCAAGAAQALLRVRELAEEPSHGGELRALLDAAELAALKHTRLEHSRGAMIEALRQMEGALAPGVAPGGFSGVVRPA